MENKEEKKQVQKKVFNSWLSRSDGVVFPGQKFKDPKENDIKSYKIFDVAIKTGDKDTDVIVKKEIRVIGSKNRRDVINADKDNVGIMNILRKEALAGVDIVKAAKDEKYASAQHGLVDLTTIPDNIDDAMKLVQKGAAAYDKLPQEIKDRMSFKDIGQLDQKGFNKLVNDKVEEILASIKEKSKVSEVKENETK